MKTLSPWRSALLAYIVSAVLNLPLLIGSLIILYPDEAYQQYIAGINIQSYARMIILSGFLYNLPLFFINVGILYFIKWKSYFKKSKKHLLITIFELLAVNFILLIIFGVFDLFNIGISYSTIAIIFTIISMLNTSWLLIFSIKFAKGGNEISTLEILESDSPETY